MRASILMVVGVFALLATAGPAQAFEGTDTFTYTFADFTYVVTFEAVNATRADVTIDVYDASGLRAQFTGRAREIRPFPNLPARVAMGKMNNDDRELPSRATRPFVARSTEALAAKFAQRVSRIIAILIS